MPRHSPRIGIARPYDVLPDDGSYRVLVDRLWPRGVSKETLKLDGWLKDLAPSADLRKWFNHQPERWDEFRRRYFQELDDQPSQVAELVAIIARQPVLLLYGSRDEQHNNAVALREYLLKAVSKAGWRESP
jgi:uncharacterized protein YeaO (DUF488 family)